jgi:outer membrane beta-barrel protein
MLTTKIANVARSLVGLGIVLWAGAAVAQTVEEAEREEDYIRVVQTQPFSHRSRFALAPTFGLSVNDPLIQHFLVGANLSYYFTESLGIQAQFHYAFDAKRAAQNALLATQLRPEMNPLKWVLTGGIEWIPIYGKFSFFNRSIVYWDAYLVAGGGVVNTDRGGVAPSGSVGLGTRIFFTSWLTLLVEVRDYLFQESFPTSIGSRSNFINDLVFSVGVSFFLPPRGK